jgi:hypothetical protein
MNMNEPLFPIVKGLFGKPEDNTFSLHESTISNIPQVGEQENEISVTPFKKEVKIAIIQMQHNEAPSIDGFPLNSIRFSRKQSNMI